QNFISLNLWGHQVKPDIILSYSGRNDFWVPYSEGSDAHFDFRGLNYLATLNDGTVRDDEPEFMQQIAACFPKLYRLTSLPFYLKFFVYSETYREIADARYKKRRGLPDALECCGRRRDPSAMRAVMDMALHNEIDGLKSIKRDFQGIPVVLAWQAVAPQEF